MVKPVTQEFYRADRTKENGVYEIGSNKPKGIASRVIQSGIAEIVQDVNVDDDYIPAIHSTRSELCIPILVNGKAQQAIVLESITPGAFTEEDKTLVKMLAEHVAIAIQNVQQVLEITRERMINMAAGMLHDIRNIVANIPDIVDELRDSLEAGDDFKQINACLHDLQISAEGTKRINQFLSDFFQYRRFHPVRTRLGPIIDRAIEDTRPDRPQNVQVLIEPSLDLPEISVDGLLIELLLKNLISNAQTSIPPECAGQVVIRTDHDESSVYIMVKDNGKGISQENKKKLFMQEFTTKADNPSLHGFGLFHCRQIVDMHQGDINVDSELGKGSIFTVILPRNGE
jgi:signal transduction histidine kinase